MANIVLIGMPGAGKTTIGKKLSKVLGRPVIDADDVVVQQTGRTIKSLFQEGENVFLNRDLAAIAGCVDKVSRPLLNSAEDRLTQLYRERMPLYLKYCDYAIPVDEDFDKTTKYIIDLIRKLGI